MQRPRQDSAQCNFSYARYLEKSFAQTYRALYGDVMFCPSEWALTWPPETNRNIRH